MKNDENDALMPLTIANNRNYAFVMSKPRREGRSFVQNACEYVDNSSVASGVDQATASLGRR